MVPAHDTRRMRCLAVNERNTHYHDLIVRNGNLAGNLKKKGFVAGLKA